MFDKENSLYLSSPKFLIYNFDTKFITVGKYFFKNFLKKIKFTNLLKINNKKKIREMNFKSEYKFFVANKLPRFGSWF